MSGPMFIFQTLKVEYCSFAYCLLLLPIQKRQNVSSNSGGSKGGGGSPGAPPYSPTFSQFHAVFWKILAKSYVGAPSSRVSAPSYGESWIRPCLIMYRLNPKTIVI